MKYMKMLGLAIGVAAALMALGGAGSASATTLWKGGSSHVNLGDTLDFSLKSGASTTLYDTGLGVNDSCSSSTLKGKTTTTGSSTETVKGTIEELTWGSCTWPTVTTVKGGLEVHHITGATNGTVTASSEIAIKFNSFCGEVEYGIAAGTDLGVLGGGKPAEFQVNAVALRKSPAILCPETAKWVATYVNTTPGGTLDVEAS